MALHNLHSVVLRFQLPIKAQFNWFLNKASWATSLPVTHYTAPIQTFTAIHLIRSLSFHAVLSEEAVLSLVHERLGADVAGLLLETKGQQCLQRRHTEDPIHFSNMWSQSSSSSYSTSGRRRLVHCALLLKQMNLKEVFSLLLSPLKRSWHTDTLLT